MMVSIIPNWHPILVHFTVALFSISTVFYLSSFLFKNLNAGFCQKISVELEVGARWCLWAAAFITIFTVLAGLNAYNTVSHDETSHIAMTDHRNWALTTATAILLLAFWSMWRFYKKASLSFIFIIAIIIAQGLLVSTAWRGGELVYRYGLGVMSLPKPEGMGHHHHEGMEPHEHHGHAE